ncbi:MAG: response regulator [Burkholderiales bacterium]|nr:response regulator [Burkholderiales bacterium]
MNDPGSPARSHLLVVEGGSSADDPVERLHAERRAQRRRVADAALRAVPWPVLSALLAAWAGAGLLFALVEQSGAAAVAGRPPAPLAANASGLLAGLPLPPWVAFVWAAAMLGLAAALVWPPQALSQRLHRPQPNVPTLVAALLALVVAAPGIWMSAPADAPWAMSAAVLAVASAALLAPLRGPALAAAAVPLLVTLPAALAGRPLRLVAGAAAAAVAATVALALHRAWRVQALHGIDQDDAALALQQSLLAAERGAEERGRFLAVASHDLRQPVHALGLFAATLHKRLQAGPDAALARHLMGAVDALERSFTAVLDISRLDAGSVAPALQTFPLRDLFRRLHMQYAGQAELAGLGLRFAPAGRWVTSDPQLLERMLGNLVQNAIRHTTQGGVVVVARRRGGWVNVEVWDTGSGIAAQDLPRVFEEFVRVGPGPRDRSQGLGMGLAIVRRLARVLGHRLEIASTPGRGTMVRIGIAAGELLAMGQPLAPADTVPMAMTEPQMVLVVDDEAPIREGLRLLLQEWGFHAVTAADAEQAEQAVHALEGRVDLVLSDLHLGPGADGLRVVAEVRRLCGRPVPAILITGDVTRRGPNRLDTGSDPVLFKPVQPRQLYEAMRAVLR